MNICIFEFKHFITISILMLLSENDHACGWYSFSNTPIIIDDLIFNICCKFRLNQLQFLFFYLLFNVSYKWSSVNTLNIKYHCKSLRNITLTWNVSSPHLNFTITYSVISLHTVHVYSNSYLFVLKKQLKQ